MPQRLTTGRVERRAPYGADGMPPSDTQCIRASVGGRDSTGASISSPTASPIRPPGVAATANGRAPDRQPRSVLARRQPWFLGCALRRSGGVEGHGHQRGRRVARGLLARFHGCYITQMEDGDEGKVEPSDAVAEAKAEAEAMEELLVNPQPCQT